MQCVLQYSSQAAQRYKQQLEKDAAKLSALPNPDTLVDAPVPVPSPSAPTSATVPASADTTAAPLAAAAAPAATSNGRDTPQENGAAEKAPAGAPSCHMQAAAAANASKHTVFKSSSSGTCEQVP